MKLTRIEKVLLLLDFAKELVQEFWQKIYGSKILKASACLSIFLIIALIFIFSYKNQANSLPSCGTLAVGVAQPGVNCLPNCSDLADGISPNPGNNCLYFGRPLCSSILPIAPQHRVNCADLVDLPLCSDIVTGGGAMVKPGKNCVDLCSSPAYNNPQPVDHAEWVRSVDYAIYNRDCIRFCDSVEDGVIAQPGINCAERKCHQLVSPALPNSGVNCNILPCNLLTPDELNKSKFDDETQKYCDGADLKCYQFTQSQLPFMRLRAINPTCVVHNCKPATASCGANDVLNITNQGATYTGVYSQYIYAGLGIDSTAICTPVDCKPVVKSQYRCTSRSVDDTVDGGGGVIKSTNVHSLGIISSITGTDDDIFRNPNCDAAKDLVTGEDGSVCGTLNIGDIPSHDTISNVTNYCFKTIDCNKTENSQVTECLVADNAVSATAGFDPFESWFYRPKPLDKAINHVAANDTVSETNTGLLNSPMDDELCYHQEQMDDGDNGLHWGRHPRIHIPMPFGIADIDIDLGWYHNYLEWEARSPGACDTTNNGYRGTGYINLCGNDGLLYNKPDEETVYFKGYATTDFTGATPKHTVTVCTRFKNTITLKACGERECGITGAFSRVTGQTCGGDVCRDLVIDEADETKCIMSSDISSSSPDDCSSTIDSYLRVRAVKYNNKICAFLDSKGQLAYDDMFMNGTESISFTDSDEINPGTVCVNDSSGVDGDCEGYDSNSSEGVADKWRALLRAHYVDNNRPDNTPDGLKGYLDKSGKLYKEQACPKVTLRVPPPDLYTVATIVNSEKLFMPPVNIRNVTKIRGGDDAIIPAGQVYGKTDFHFPEVKVQFGAQVLKMSLGFGYTGYEDSDHAEVYAASPSFTTATTNFNGRSYEARLFVRKEFMQNTNVPQLCLYRRIKDQNGIDIEPLLIGCVERNAPDINNKKDIIIDPNLPFRKMMIYPKSDNQYNNSKINIRFLDGGADKIDNNCTGDDRCSAEISLTNSDYKTPTCFQDIEKHKICVQREECSAIYIECIQNEIDLNNARIENKDSGKFLGIRKQCSETLIPNCNRKRGITSGSGNIYNPIPENASIDVNAYGWFNELCIVTGFQPKLKKVITRAAVNGIMGKCFIDPSSPYIIDGNPATNCNDGGRAPNCLCLEAPKDYITNENEIVRLQTHREAGLCIDMPVPSFCPLIDYNQTPNPDLTDPEYVNQSLGKSVYNNVTGVNLAHQNRSNGAISGYAEFTQALLGIDDVRGECKGFWTYNKNSSGVVLFPLQSCLNNNGRGEWDSNVRNKCIRFSCPDVLTSGPDILGVYQAGYGSLESGEMKGAFNGFATWNKYTKTNDFLETRAANACIPGFKPVGGAAVFNASGVITSYSGGTLPTRQCNQVGNWSEAVNSCARIACPATNLANPTSAADAALWTKWYNNGGATFPSVKASRSMVRTQAESIATGICNTDLGFFPAGSSPTRECDYLGNWKPVKNPCATACSAITSDNEGSSLNNGFSKWNVIKKEVILYENCNYTGWSMRLGIGDYFDLSNSQARNASSIKFTGGVIADLYDNTNFTGRSVELVNDNSCFSGINFNEILSSLKVKSSNGVPLVGEFAGCVAGYVTNPYPPLVDSSGNALSSNVANDLSRVAESPKRMCNAFAGSSFTSWGGVTNPCINECPGFDVDPRSGVGITTHPIKSSLNGTINIKWASTALGQYAYATNWTGQESLFNAVYFQATAASPRTNGYYLLRRFCNNNGKWNDPETMCSANGGQISNAKYFDSTADAGYKNSIPVDGKTVSGTCINDKYWFSDRGVGASPEKKCVYADSNNYIDKAYLEFANNTKDCELKTCPNYAGWTGLRGKIAPANKPAAPAVDQRFIDGGQLVGSCINGATNSQQQVVFTTLMANGTLPYVVCRDDGTWSTPDDSSCKYGCDIPGLSKVCINDQGDNDAGWNGGVCSGYASITMAHGQVVVVEVTDKAGGGCTQYFSTMSCIDGHAAAIFKNGWNRDTGNGCECNKAIYNSATRDSDLRFVIAGERLCNDGDYMNAAYTGPTGPNYINKYGQSAIFIFNIWHSN